MRTIRQIMEVLGGRIGKNEVVLRLRLLVDARSKMD